MYCDAINSGLSDAEAKALSDLMHFRARQIWGYGPNQVSKFSETRLKLGLRPCIDMTDKPRIWHRSIFRMLTQGEASRYFNALTKVLRSAHGQGALESRSDGLANAQARAGPVRSTFVSSALKSKYKARIVSDDPLYDHRQEAPSPRLMVTYLANEGSEYLWERKLDTGMGHRVSGEASLHQTRVKPGIRVVNYRSSDRDEYSALELYVSSYPLVSVVNSDSTYHEISLHILRSKKKADFKFPEDFVLEDDPVRRYMQFDSLMIDASVRRGNMRRLEYVPKAKVVDVAYCPTISLGIPADQTFTAPRPHDFATCPQKFKEAGGRIERVGDKAIVPCDVVSVSVTDSEIIEALNELKPANPGYLNFEGDIVLSQVKKETIDS